MSKVLNLEFGKKVLHLRQTKKVTQSTLAKSAGIHVTFLSGVEKGQRNVTVDTAQKIATALNVSLADLFQPDSN